MTTLSPLETLQTYLRWQALVVLWAEMPWSPVNSLPAARAALLGRMRGEARDLPPIPWSIPDLPPVPILSLDPSERLARAFSQAHRPLRIVRTRSDVPQAGRHSLLQLGGDLVTRQGVMLSWADVNGLTTDPDKRYLLDEAARICKDGAVLILMPRPNQAFVRLWRQALAPALRAGVVFGLGSGPWPEGVEVIGKPLETILTGLAAVAPAGAAGRRHTPAFETLLAERAQRVRRLQALQNQALQHPHNVDLQLEIEQEETRIAELEHKLDAMLEAEED